MLVGLKARFKNGLEDAFLRLVQQRKTINEEKMSKKEVVASVISISVPDSLFDKVDLALGNKNHQTYSLFRGSENRDVAIRCVVVAGKSFFLEFLKPERNISKSFLEKLIKVMSVEYKSAFSVI